MDHVPYVEGQNYQVEIVAYGTQLEVWIDGIRIFQVDDSAHRQGSVAFYSWSSAGAYFDDLVVEDLSGGAGNAFPADHQYDSRACKHSGYRNKPTDRGGE